MSLGKLWCELFQRLVLDEKTYKKFRSILSQMRFVSLRALSWKVYLIVLMWFVEVIMELERKESKRDKESVVFSVLVPDPDKLNGSVPT